MPNQGTYRLSLLDTRSQAAADADVRVTFKRQDGTVISATSVDLSARVSFTLPAFPDVRALFGLLEPSRFRTREIPFFMLTHGEIVERQLSVFRAPAQWTAVFDPWATVQASAADLATVLANSPDMLVRGWKSYPLLTAATYDALGVDREREELPKATLLNVYSRLSTTTNPTAGRPWFSYVERVLELTRERVMALVDPAMGRAVQAIRGNIDRYADYKPASAELHWPNFPARYGVLKKDMFSIKTTHAKGNLQLTLAPGTDAAGRSVLLLDADIDENGKWLAHTMDVFKHKFTGGTHPFDIHDGLALENVDWPIGYRLA
jgi:hypothetical protein